MNKPAFARNEKAFLESVKVAGRFLTDVTRPSALVVHHGDADGLCSAAILKLALERENWDVRAICLEKLFPEVLERIHSTDVGAVIYADLGSPHVERISEANKGRRTTIVVDHHDPRTVQDKTVLNLNPELSGIDGESQASSSTVAYLLALELSESNSDTAPIALVGSSELPGDILGLNGVVLEKAVTLGTASVVRARSTQRVKVKLGNDWWDRKKASSLITALGSVGYYRDGPRLAMNAIARGIDRTTKEVAGGLEAERRSRFNALFSKMGRSTLAKMDATQWLDVRNKFTGMGSKVIGTFLSILRYKRMVDPNKYLLGFMWLDPSIPGLGSLEGSWTKVSARIPPPLEPVISSGAMLPLSTLLSGAADAVGGFADGHAFASSGVVPREKMASFLERFDGLAARQGSGKLGQFKKP